MSNEEKSEVISLKYAREYMVSRRDRHKQNILFKESSIIECEKAAMEMAQWKDEYYKKLLDLLVKSGANVDIITNYIENCIEL